MDHDHHEILFRSRDGTTGSTTLEEAGSLLPEELDPYRVPPSYRKQRHMPGLYWFASSREHVIYESRLELKALIQYDFDSAVTRAVAQPFAFLFAEGGKRKLHVPDYLVERPGGPDLVVDVKPTRRAAEPKTKRVLEVTREMCGEVGWDYEVFTGEDEPVFVANVEWLSGFRRLPLMFNEVSRDVMSVARDGGATIGKIVGESSPPALSRPVIYHMLWRQSLSADLSNTLSDESVIHTANTAKEARERGR